MMRSLDFFSFAGCLDRKKKKNRQIIMAQNKLEITFPLHLEGMMSLVILTEIKKILLL